MAENLICSEVNKVLSFTVQCSVDLLVKIVGSLVLRFALKRLMYDLSTEKGRKHIKVIGETHEQAFGIHYADGYIW